MPIELGNVAWPPVECHKPNRFYREWGAWYGGDPETLEAVYSESGYFTGTAVDKRYSATLGGGVRGALARLWWGRPTSSPGQPSVKLHIPAAGDLSMYAADLLFGAPPEITIGDPVKATSSDGVVLTSPSPATERWQTISEEIGFDSRMLEGSEQGSAYGGIYLRASVLPKVNGWRPVEAPIVGAIPPDAAIPEWRGGFLTAVTFWREVGRTGGSALDKVKVWRHLERHEPGMVYHALYLGTPERLGEPMSLAASDATAELVPAAKTGATGLAVEYVPNMRPHRLIRGTNLGRSDYAGAEPSMDALDETWSSWMRDIRLAKARLVVPEALLQSNGKGEGASFDADREIWAAIGGMPAPDAKMLTPVQFLIRVNEHRDTAAAALRQIWRTAGYSVGENGEETEAQGAATATEVVSRGARTAATRSRKIGYWQPALRRLARAMLEMDMAAGFSRGLDLSGPIAVEFPPAVAPDPKQRAETLELLGRAKFISTRTAVEELHPEWPEERVLQEVEAIEKATPEPDAFGDGPPPPMEDEEPPTEE